MYQYNSIMSAVNDFIDEVNESDSNAKLVKPHTIKDAYELLAGYYGKETGAELLAEYEAGRPHDVADATKLLLDVLKNKEENKGTRWPFYYVSDGEPIRLFGKSDSKAGVYVQCPEGTSIAAVNKGAHYSDGLYNCHCYIFNRQTTISLFTIDINGNRINSIVYPNKVINILLGNRYRTALLISKVVQMDNINYTFLDPLFRQFIKPYDAAGANIGISSNDYKYNENNENNESLARQGETAWNYGVVFPLPDRN